MIDTSKPAYPVDGGDVANGGIGMTLREYYAGLAMQGLCSNPAIVDSNGAEKWIARYASALANVLIEEFEG